MFLLIGRICVGSRSAGVERFGAGSCSLIAWGEACMASSIELLRLWEVDFLEACGVWVVDV
ncbi:hypothetical protein [Bartonella raoultii]|uniref:hypothetical protein n=1 Tax=Bartonella raoultii TaxID=1457020 RepID=UPI001ABB1345|nr:hypothetical protein [Bartonella raoultii]